MNKLKFKSVPMRLVGYTALVNELKKMKRIDRTRISKAIAEAAAHGDLKENAEYHAAREEQSFLEKKIAEIEYRLSNANVIDSSKIKNKGIVVFGAKVSVLNISLNNREEYLIVGEDELNLLEGKISINSLMARSMIGKKLGDIFIIEKPTTEHEYEILEINYE